MQLIEKNTLYKYMPLHLALLIPVQGRLVFGLTLVLEQLLLTVTGTLINSLVNKLKLEALRTVIILMTLVSTTILFRQILVLTYTEIALILGYMIFIPPISLFFMQVIYSDMGSPLAARLKANVIQTAVFSLLSLILFLFRDIAGYGTITYFSGNHMFSEKVLFAPHSVGIFSFFATIPGILVLGGALLFLLYFLHEKIKIVKRTEITNDLH